MPRKPIEMWCEVCDLHAVSTNNPDTGKFYAVYGEVNIGRMDSEPTKVVFAVCKNCDVKDSIHEVTLDPKLQLFTRKE